MFINAIYYFTRARAVCVSITIP